MPENTQERLSIDIEEIQRFLEWRGILNRTPLRNIDFFEDGKLVEYPETLIEEFEYTGLSNLDFIATEFYKLDQSPT
jgi:hypothetical protein